MSDDKESHVMKKENEEEEDKEYQYGDTDYAISYYPFIDVPTSATIDLNAGVHRSRIYIVQCDTTTSYLYSMAANNVQLPLDPDLEIYVKKGPGTDTGFLLPEGDKFVLRWDESYIVFYHKEHVLSLDSVREHTILPTAPHARVTGFSYTL